MPRAAPWSLRPSPGRTLPRWRSTRCRPGARQSACRRDDRLIHRVIRPAPRELTGRTEDASLADVVDDLKAKTEAGLPFIEKDPGMIGRHQLHRLWSQQSDPIQLTAVEHHLQQACVIGGRREKAG